MTISKQKRLVRLGAAAAQTRADSETGMMEQIPEFLWAVSAGDRPEFGVRVVAVRFTGQRRR